jgi:hypothetical protein
MSEATLSNEKRLEILLRVRELVKHQWCKRSWARLGRSLADPNKSIPKYCLGGACTVAANELLTTTERVQLHIPATRPSPNSIERLHGLVQVPPDVTATKVLSIASVVEKEHGTDFVPSFNDRMETTNEDVLKVVNKRIRQVQAQIRKEKKNA